MSFRSQLQLMKLTYCLRGAENLPFPSYLRTIRRVLRHSREYVSQFTSIPAQRIQYLEEGRFRRMPEFFELSQLAEFYFQSPDDFFKKAEKFLSEKEAE